MLSMFGLQDAHFVTTPIGTDDDNDLLEVDSMLPNENSNGSASVPVACWFTTMTRTVYAPGHRLCVTLSNSPITCTLYK